MLRPSHRSARVAFHSDALSTCFRGELRSSKLGLRHVDKGIYFDQLYRWFANFDSRSFMILNLEDFSKKTDFYLLKVLNFISTQGGKEGGKFRDDKRKSKNKLLALGGASSGVNFGLRFLSSPNSIVKKLAIARKRFEDLLVATRNDAALAEKWYLQRYHGDEVRVDEIRKFIETETALREFYKPYTKKLEDMMKGYGFGNN